MSALKNRLLEAESLMLESLSNPQKIKDFKQDWYTLTGEIEKCLPLEDDIHIQYQSTSRLVEELSKSMLQFYEDVDAIDAAFQQDLDDIFTRWAKSGVAPSQTIPPSSRRDVSLAAKWISQHFPNPYPSSSIRDNISQQANWSRKDVDAWFTEARKRMGWNDIRKRFFGNRRAETIQNATQFFEGQLCCDPALSQAFFDMENRVKELFVEPFGQKHNMPDSVSFQRDARSRILSISSPGHCPLSPISRSISPLRNASRKRRKLVTDERVGEESPSKRPRISNQTQLPSPPASQADLAESNGPFSQEQSIRSPSLPPTLGPNRQWHSICQKSTLSSVSSSSYGRDTCLQTDSTPPPPSFIEFSSAYDPYTSVPRSSTPSPSLAAKIHTEAFLPPDQEEFLRLLLLPPHFADFSTELPYTVTCDQPMTTCGVDMSLFSDTQLTEPVIDDSCPHSTPAKSMHTLSSSLPCDNSVDFSTFSGFLDQPLSDEQPIGLSSPAHNHHNTFDSLQEVDALLNPFRMETNDSNSKTASQQHVELSMNEQTNDIFLTNFNEISSPSIPSFETGKARQVAHLEALKNQKDRLQEYIQFLEKQLTGVL